MIRISDSESIEFFQWLIDGTETFSEKFVDYKTAINIFLTIKKVIFVAKDTFLVIQDDLAAFEFALKTYNTFYIINYKNTSVSKFIVRRENE